MNLRRRGEKKRTRAAEILVGRRLCSHADLRLVSEAIPPISPRGCLAANFFARGAFYAAALNPEMSANAILRCKFVGPFLYRRVLLSPSALCALIQGLCSSRIFSYAETRVERRVQSQSGNSRLLAKSQRGGSPRTRWRLGIFIGPRGSTCSVKS